MGFLLALTKLHEALHGAGSTCLGAPSKILAQRSISSGGTTMHEIGEGRATLSLCE
jgi:hypothetical protein